MPTKWIETQVVSENDYRHDATTYGPVRYPLLAEGDSWFDSNGQRGDNLLKALALPDSSLILNFAYAGDEIRRMTKLGRKSYLGLLFKEPTRFWSGFLVSGGGNDLITDAGKIIRKPLGGSDPVNPESYLDLVALKATLDSVVEGYQRLAALRVGTAHDRLPMLAHTYDYAMPRNAPAKVFGFSKGPWLYPRLVAAKVPEGMHAMVADTLFSRLAETIKHLADPQHPTFITDFHVVDTRGILLPANPSAPGKSNDWLNEIHPTADGYAKIAATRFNQALTAILSL